MRDRLTAGGGLNPGGAERTLSALESLGPQLLPLATNSTLNPTAPMEGSVVVVFLCVCFFLPFPFPFSVFVAHLLQSTSLQEPKLNKLPICHASLVVCSPHCHLAYLLSQKEKERERKSRKEGGGGEEGKEKQGRGRGGRGREIREGGTQANEEREKGGGEPDTMRRQG